MIDQTPATILLVFAHRGEAQQFFQEHALMPDGAIIDLYHGDEFDLLLCGEGVENAIAKTAYCLGRKKYSEVINFGIAAACEKSLEKQEVYSVRTVYAHNKDMQFKSFPISESGVDCVSANERIFDDEKCEYLSHFASLIDRELWGIAHACDQLKTKLSAYKLVSDFASDHEACEDIKAKAKDFSLLMYQAFMNIQSDAHTKENHFDIPNGFHFTQSLLRRYKSLKQSLDLKDKSWLEKIDFEKIKESIKRPKTRTIELIAQMEHLLSPEQMRLRATLDRLKKGLETDQVKLAYDKSLESDRFRAMIEFGDFEELDKQIKKIKHFPIDRAKELLNGLQ